MKERPILFSGPMVRAILEGRKTQTRRVMKSQPYTLRTELGTRILTKAGGFVSIQSPHCLAECPHGITGDRLWVRETLGVVANWGTIQYAADNAFAYDPESVKAGFPHTDEAEAIVERWGDSYNTSDFKLLPSIFMPRWASRITLEIRDVRVQRLQEISEEDAVSEGIEAIPNSEGPNFFSYQHGGGWHNSPTAKESFSDLWDSINAKRGFGWDKNPWLWALTFSLVRP